MNLTLAGMLNEFIKVYLDGILVYSETQQEYIMHIIKVFERFKNSKLLCKLEKYEFEKDYIKYLGHKIGYRIVQVDPSKTALLVLSLPQPMSRNCSD